MKSDFPQALARILVYEGGKVDDPHDPGGRTAYGITQRTYNAWRHAKGLSMQDVYLIAESEKQTIYKEEYWDKVHGDDLPAGLDLVVFDAAVNSGIGAATMWLQSALGIEADGAFGLKTLDAAKNCDDERTINSMCARRLGTLQHNRNWPRYKGGWSARIANVLKTGDSWAEAGSAEGNHPDPVDVTSAGGHRKADTTDIKPQIVTQVVAHTVTAASAASTAATQVGAQLAPTADLFNWMKYVLGGLTVVSAVAGVILLVGKNARDAASNGVAVAKVDLLADEKFPRVILTKPAVA